LLSLMPAQLVLTVWLLLVAFLPVGHLGVPFSFNGFVCLPPWERF